MELIFENRHKDRCTLLRLQVSICIFEIYMSDVANKECRPVGQLFVAEYEIINPNSLYLSSLSSLSHLKLTPSKGVVPPVPGTPRTPIPSPPMPSHNSDAARLIPYLYRPCVDHVVGLPSSSV